MVEGVAYVGAVTAWIRFVLSVVTGVILPVFLLAANPGNPAIVVLILVFLLELPEEYMGYRMTVREEKRAIDANYVYTELLELDTDVMLTTAALFAPIINGGNSVAGTTVASIVVASLIHLFLVLIVYLNEWIEKRASPLLAKLVSYLLMAIVIGTLLLIGMLNAAATGGDVDFASLQVIPSIIIVVDVVFSIRSLFKGLKGVRLADLSLSSLVFTLPASIRVARGSGNGWEAV